VIEPRTIAGEDGIRRNNMSTPSVEIVKVMPQAQDVYQPVMTIDQAITRRETIVQFVARIMVKDQDFGVIPGTSSKPVLLKPGAEKLCNFFGLEPEFTPITEEADWTGEHHNGEPFYYIRYRCRLTRNGVVMGVGEGCATPGNRSTAGVRVSACARHVARTPSSRAARSTAAVGSASPKKAAAARSTATKTRPSSIR